MISTSTVEKIIEAADLVEVIGEFVELKKQGANYVGKSPFSNERTASFTVSPAKGIFKDFSSGKGGNVISFLMEHEKFTYPEALKWLAKKYKIEVIESEQTPEMLEAEKHRESLMVITERAARQFEQNLSGSEVAKAYLDGRGFSAGIVDKFGLGYAGHERDGFTKLATGEGYQPELISEAGLTIKPETGSSYDRFRDRLMFPIHSSTGRVIGFGGRILTPGADKSIPKYINSPESAIYHKSKVLYGLFFAKKPIRAEDNCYLVEGYADVLAAHQAGIENVVASSGTSLTVDQIRLIGKLTKNITILYDGDTAGIKATLRGLDLVLQEGLNVKLVTFPDGHDPDSYLRLVGADDFKVYIEKERKDFILYKADLLLSRASVDPIGKAGVLRDIIESIAKIPDAIKASIYIKQCSKLFDIEEIALSTELAKLRSNPKALTTHTLDPIEREATPAEKDGEWLFETRPSFTDEDINVLFPKYALTGISSYTGDKVNFFKEDQREDAYARIRSTLDKMRVHPLTSYRMIQNRRALIYEATHGKPMFLIDEGAYKLIYQPFAPKEATRYIPIGTVPRTFIHGAGMARAEFDRREKKKLENQIALANSNGESQTTDVQLEDLGPLKELILVHDPASALPLALMGYYPFYVTGEKPELTTFELFTGDKALKKLCYKIYQVREQTDHSKKICHEIALEHLDIYTIELPVTVKIKTDIPQQQYKLAGTLWEFLSWQNQFEFNELMKQALPYKFWGEEPQYNKSGKWLGYKYDFKSTQSYNFLNKMGFYRLPVEGRKSDYVFIHREGNIVREKTPNKVKNFIHEFLKERRLATELRDTMYESTRLNEASLSNLDEIEIEFSDNDEKTQFLFFQNGTLAITADQIHLHEPGEIKRFVWERDVIDHNFTGDVSPFTITKNKDGVYDIKVNHNRCHFFNFMIQTSRIHWRRELEEVLPERYPEKADRDKYLQEHKFEIDSELLSLEERFEQKQHLINKIFAFGYVVHQYKSRSKSWAVVGTDDKLSHNDKSNGGSGKSLLFNQSLSYVFSPKSIHKIPGTEPRITQNPHIFHGLDKDKKALVIDDADKNLPFRFFFEYVTGDQVVNNKNGDIFTIAFKDLCKLIWLTNFSFNTDSSTERRILYFVASDYYHQANETNDYKETREPRSEFGMDLFTQFSEEEFNRFYNTVAYCTQFFLSCPIKFNPPMSSVTKRKLLREMGPEFEGWASLYLNEISGNLDKYIIKAEAMQEFMREHPQFKTVSSQWFKKALEAFCKYNGYVFNPEEIERAKDGRIIQSVWNRTLDKAGEWVVSKEKKTHELFYVQTKFDQPLNLTLPGPQPAEPLPF